MDYFHKLLSVLQSMALISRIVAYFFIHFIKTKAFFKNLKEKVNFGESPFQRSMKYHVIFFSHFRGSMDMWLYVDTVLIAVYKHQPHDYLVEL